MSTEDGKRRLEDRFNTADLWISMTLRGRWVDVDDNTLWISRLTHRPPQSGEGDTKTRTSFYESLPQLALDKESPDDLFETVSQIVPVEITRAIRPRRASRKNLEGLWIYETTNKNAIICAFRPKSPEKKEITDWYVACLEIGEGTDYHEAFEQFDSEFLDRIYIPSLRERKTKPVKNLKKVFWEDKKTFSKKSKEKIPSDSELLRDDYRASVANYGDWHWVECENITVESCAKELYVSPSHLIRTFKTETGQTPHKFLMDEKLKEAETLIKLGVLSLKEVASLTSFSSSAHLITAYKKKYGKTPKCNR
jgi:AraC-like DNA-binding protein